MANQAITELIIDADPTGGEARYRAAMDRIAAADQQRIDRQARVDAAMEKGIAVVTQTTAAIERQARAWAGIVGKTDPVAKAVLTAEREMARAVNVTTAAVESGLTSRIEAERVLTNLRQQQVVKIEEVRAAQLRLTQATDQEAAAIERVAAAQAHAQSGGGFHATNLMFQAQDIAMMTLLGQAPAAIALQQGLQVGGIFSQIGNGKAIVTALGSAIAGLLSPINLATIAVIGLGAAGVQAFMHMQSANENAIPSLDDYRKKLDGILTGYDRAREAAKDALDPKLPRGVVISDLTKSLADQEKAAQDVQKRIEQARAGLADTAQFLREMQNIGRSGGNGDGALGPVIDQIEQLRNLGISTSSTTAELDAAVVAARELFNTAKDPAIRDLADKVYQLAIQLRTARIEAEGTSSALEKMPRDVEIRIAVNAQFNKNLQDLEDLYIDPRSQFDIKREQAKNAATELSATAHSYAELVGIGKEYDRVVKSIDAAEAAAAAKHHSPKTDFEKAEDAYKRLIRTTQQSIGQTQMQAQVLGMTDQQASAFLHTQELLNQAANDNIELTPQQTAELRAYGAAMAQVEEDTRRVTEAYNFGRDTLSGFFSSFKQNLMSGTSLWSSFANAATSAIDKVLDKALDAASSQAFNWLWNAAAGALGFGGGGGWNIPTTYQPNGFYPAFPSANGNAFAKAPGLNAYANTIVNRPTLFPFANGIGLMGETGEPGEAIMPLGRNSRGQLGVQVANQNQSNDNWRGAAPVVNVNVIDQSGQRLEKTVRKRQTANGVDIDVMIAKSVTKPGGPAARGLETQYGLRRQLIRRGS